MGTLSEINLGNQILSFVVAGGLVAFAALVLRILFSGLNPKSPLDVDLIEMNKVEHFAY